MLTVFGANVQATASPGVALLVYIPFTEASIGISAKFPISAAVQFSLCPVQCVREDLPLSVTYSYGLDSININDRAIPITIDLLKTKVS
jgi:hypothetical protein